MQIGKVNKTINKSIIIDVTQLSTPEYLRNTQLSVKREIQNKIALNQELLFFGDAKKILVPKKVESVLRNHIPKENLKLIDSNIEVAIEKCLLFLSNLSTCCYTDNKYKILHSINLHDQLKVGKHNTYIYTKVIQCLREGSPKNGPIIEVLQSKANKDLYYSGQGGSKRYRLATRYSEAGTVYYELKQAKIISQRVEYQCRKLKETMENPIGKNLLSFYHLIQLPSEKEISEEADRLLKIKFITKKGKRLTKGSRKTSKHLDKDSRAFIEDHIALYNTLTKNGFIIPSVTGESAGGRVVDSFTLMPSWIRNLVKIDGASIEELDYAALHPNIAVSIYGGKQKGITHERLQKCLDIEKSEVKVEHLSFFNKDWDAMSISPLFWYYKQTEPEMMENIFKDKLENGYKITSQRLFKKEVDIISKAIEFLNSEEIYVGYVYDALFCHPRHRERVKEVMNYFVREAGVCTKVK